MFREMGRRPNPPCTAPGFSYIMGFISKACFFCTLFWGISKKGRICIKPRLGLK